MPKLPQRVRALAHKYGHVAVVVAGLALLVFASLGLAQRYRATHNPNPLPPSSVAAQDGKLLDETPIAVGSKTGNDYKTAPGDPRIIRLPSIGTEGFIQKVGLDTQGAVGVPSNISLAGWYSLEPKPGDSGVSVIDGHVQGVYNPGIFKNLAKLQTGDIFSIEFGDRTERLFEVVSVKSYAASEVSKPLFARQAGVTRQLNLITCGGTYNRQTKQYEQRVLVVSKRLD